MTKRIKQTQQTVDVPGSRLRWLAAELQRAGEEYEVERNGEGYRVYTHTDAAPVTDRVLGYHAHGRGEQPQRKPSWIDKLRAGAQILPYFLREIAVVVGVIAVLIAGVKFFGLGQLDPAFAILFRGGADMPLLRAIALIFVLLALASVLRTVAGPRPGGTPPGTTTHRLLSVLLLGGVVVALVLAWMGRL